MILSSAISVFLAKSFSVSSPCLPYALFMKAGPGLGGGGGAPWEGRSGENYRSGQERRRENSSPPRRSNAVFWVNNGVRYLRTDRPYP